MQYTCSDIKVCTDVFLNFVAAKCIFVNINTQLHNLAHLSNWDKKEEEMKSSQANQSHWHKHQYM